MLSEHHEKAAALIVDFRRHPENGAAQLPALNEALLKALGPFYKDNPMDESEASWTEPKHVRQARYDEVDREEFARLVVTLGTSQEELRSFGVAADIFPG